MTIHDPRSTLPVSHGESDCGDSEAIVESELDSSSERAARGAKCAMCAVVVHTRKLAGDIQLHPRSPYRRKGFH